MTNSSTSKPHLSHEVHGQILNGDTKVIQRSVRPVGGIDDVLRLLGSETRLDLLLEGFLILVDWRQVALHCRLHE